MHCCWVGYHQRPVNFPGLRSIGAKNLLPLRNKYTEVACSHKISAIIRNRHWKKTCYSKRFDSENFVSLRKAGKFPFNDIHVNQLPIGHAISREKITDLNKILPKMYDDNWAEEPLADKRQKWFKNFIFDELTT